MTSAIGTSNEAWPVAKNKMVTAIVASLLGWSLDLFDLFILLYVAPVVGKLFFPSAVPTLSLAAVYASFAVTLLMRPVGSALFGSYGDRYGRRGAMIVAVVGVGIATALFGALPTINQIGIAAPIIFIILRLIQGIFVGGVVASTHTIGTELVPPHWRGAMSGLIGGGGAGIGALVASIAYFVATEAFPGDAVRRVGLALHVLLRDHQFACSASSSSTSSRNRRSGPSCRPRAAKVLRAPVRALFSREYLPVLLVNLLITIGGGAGYYLTSGYLPTFLKVVSKLPSAQTSAILIAGSFVVIIASVLAGHLSHLVGAQADVPDPRHHPHRAAAVLLHRHGAHAGRRHAGVLGPGADVLRQCRLRADRHLPQRALPDRAARDRHRPVVEYRLRASAA